MNALHLNNIVYKFNDLKKNERLYTIDFDSITSFEQRKNEILLKQLHYYDKVFDVLNEALILTQNLYDFIIFNKIDKHIKTKKKESKDFLYFQEVRGCFFLYLDSQKKEEEVFEGLSDRKFSELSHRRFSQNSLALPLKFLIPRKNEMNVMIEDDIFSGYSKNSSFDIGTKDYNYELLPKNKKNFNLKKILKSHKSEGNLINAKVSSFFLTNSISIAFPDIKDSPQGLRGVKRNNSNLSLNTQPKSSKYVDANTNTFHNPKIAVEKSSLFKPVTKFQINDQKLRNFCKDLIRLKEVKDDLKKVSLNPGFIGRAKVNEQIGDTKVIDNKDKKASKSIPSKFQTSFEINEEDNLKDLKRYYHYLSILNKIPNLSSIGSTRLDSPFNRRKRNFDELKEVVKSKESRRDKGIQLTNREHLKSKFGDVFRHNKPLSIVNHKLHSKLKKQESLSAEKVPISSVNYSAVNMNFPANKPRNECIPYLIQMRVRS